MSSAKPWMLESPLPASLRSQVFWGVPVRQFSASMALPGAVQVAQAEDVKINADVRSSRVMGAMARLRMGTLLTVDNLGPVGSCGRHLICLPCCGSFFQGQDPCSSLGEPVLLTGVFNSRAYCAG